MNLGKRRLLFWALLFFFIIFGSAVVFYSEGWRINLDSCSIKNLESCDIKFEKSGAIFIQTNPRGVIIKIDGKDFEDKSGLIQSGTLITDLVPKTYRVKITKDGFLPWEKDMRVRAQLVTEADRVILVPKNIEKELIQLPRLRGQRIESLSGDGNKFVLKDPQSGTYYLYDLKNLSTVFNINLNFANVASGKQTIKKVIIHPFDSDKLITETNQGLSILDVSRLRLEAILEYEPLIWTTKNSNIFYIERIRNPDLGTTSFVLDSWNLVIKNENQLLELPKYATQGLQLTKLDISPSQNRIAFLNNLDDLYIISQTDGSIQKIAHNASDFAFSPDSKKIAFLDKDRKLNILFLDDWNSDNPKRAGDVVRFSLEEQPHSIVWYRDSYHLLIAYPNELNFREIDDRLPNNNYTLTEGIGDNFYYNLDSSLIYFLKEKNLYRLRIE